MTKPSWFSIPQLVSCRLKIERANENIRNLESEIGPFLQTNANCLFSEEDPKTGHYSMKFVGDVSSVTRFSVLAGEIVYHLRSSLDHLVWRLTNPALHSKHTSFPIYISDPRKHPKPNVLKGYERKIEGVSSTARAIIERMQPYHRATPVNDPLAIINELNVKDKHHELAVTFVRAKVTALIYNDSLGRVLNPPGALSSLRVEDGAELFRIVPIIGKMDVKPEVGFYVAFPEIGTWKNESIIPTLVQLCDATVNTIEMFAGEKFP